MRATCTSRPSHAVEQCISIYTRLRLHVSTWHNAPEVGTCGTRACATATEHNWAPPQRRTRDEPARQLPWRARAERPIPAPGLRGSEGRGARAKGGGGGIRGRPSGSRGRREREAPRGLRRNRCPFMRKGSSDICLYWSHHWPPPARLAWTHTPECGAGKRQSCAALGRQPSVSGRQNIQHKDDSVSPQRPVPRRDSHSLRSSAC